MALGVFGFVFSLAALFNPYSPLSGVESGRLVIIIALLVLAGPHWMLPLAILARWWPRLSGRLLLGGSVSAVVLTAHPYGLMYASPGLYTDIQFLLPVIALVTALVGTGLVIAERSGRRWSEVVVTIFAAWAVTSVVATGVGVADAATPLRTGHDIGFLAFAPDGNSLIAGSRAIGSPGVSVLDVVTGTPIELAAGSFQQRIGSDSTTLVTVDREATRLWDTRTFRERTNMAKPNIDTGIAVSATTVALMRPDGVHILDAASGAEQHHLRTDRRRSWLAISADGRFLVAGGGGEPGANLWDVPTMSRRVISDRPGEEVVTGQVSPLKSNLGHAQQSSDI